MTPHIGAVSADVKRQITEQQHTPFAGEGTDRRPLPVQQPLNELHLKNGIAVVLAPPLERILLVG